VARGRIGGFSLRGRRSKRAVDWVISSQSTTFTAIASGATTDFAAAVALSAVAVEPFTIIRQRGLLSVASDQIAATEVQIGALGTTIVTLRASAAGVASLPRPQSDPFADWMLLQPFSQVLRFASAVGFESQMVTQYVLDSKAMRKVESPVEQALTILIENVGSTGIEVNLHLRFLVKFG